MPILLFDKVPQNPQKYTIFDSIKKLSVLREIIDKLLLTVALVLTLLMG